MGDYVIHIHVSCIYNTYKVFFPKLLPAVFCIFDTLTVEIRMHIPICASASVKFQCYTKPQLFNRPCF